MEIPKQKHIILSLEYSTMYDISGQKVITEHSFNRYIRGKEQDEVIFDL